MSEIFVKFFTLVSILLIIYLDVELILRILTSPILFHDPLQVYLAIKLQSIVLFELATFPDKNLMRVILVVWVIKLRLDTQNYHTVIY